MKKLLFIFFTAGLIQGFSSCSHKDIPNNALTLIPQPQEMKVGADHFKLTRRAAITLDTSNPQLMGIARYFNNKVTSATGFEIPVEKHGNIEFKLTDDTALGAEGYRLQVKHGDIIITAHQPAGIFYGVQTLLQMLPPEIKNSQKQKGIDWTVPCTDITDKPQFAWRGLMLDVSRHWFTKEEVKKYIDELAEYKMNVFHWHLTDDQGWRLEIKSLPRLTEVGAWRAPRVGQWWQRAPQQPGEETTYGGFYTQEDVKEVLAYAAERYVRVIPEIDVPGHSLAALVAYPDLACMKAPSAVGVGNKFYGEDENTLCVGKDATFEFMDKVLTEVAALFPDEYVHIGGDECFKGFWHKCPRCQARMKAENLKNENELQSYFIHRMESILKEKGKKLIGWDEIIDGGLAPDATVMSWRGMEGGIKSAKAGHHVIMTPTEHCYIDLWQGEPSVEPDTYFMCRLKDSYSFNPVPDSVPAEMILGGQGNLWAESVPTFRHAEYMTWPRGWALAEVLWTGPSKTDWDRFWPRVERHFVRADQAQINYARSMYNAIVTPYYTEDGVLEIKLDSEPGNLDIYYTFDNTDPDNFTPKYEAPLRIPKNATWLRIVTYRDNKPIGKVITLTIKELEKQYARALKEITDKVKSFQADIDLLDQALSQDGLDDDTKALLQSQKRSKVYQQNYQKALKGQVSGVLDKLHGDNYATIDKYLKSCYETGYIGTMYDIAKQGVPIIAPIDQAAAVKAILTDSKIVDGYYNHLGVNYDKLKKTITQEISRGIASGLPYSDIARNINNVSGSGLSNAKRISRTEGSSILLS